MMDMKATNVTLVVKHLLNYKPWRLTYTQFMMDIRISDAPEHMLARSSLGARSFDWCSYSGFDIEQMLEARSCLGLMLGSTRRALGMEKV